MLGFFLILFHRETSMTLFNFFLAECLPIWMWAQICLEIKNCHDFSIGIWKFISSFHHFSVQFENNFYTTTTNVKWNTWQKWTFNFFHVRCCRVFRYAFTLNCIIFLFFFEADQVQVMKIDMIFHRTHISCVEPLNCLLLTAQIDQDVPNADVLGTTAT